MTTVGWLSNDHSGMA